MKKSRYSRRWHSPAPGAGVAMILSLLASPLSSQQIRIAELWSTTGSEKVAELAYIAGMAEVGNGDIWISEGLGTAFLLAVGPDGRNPRIVAGDGKGPGEVDGPTLMAARPGGGVAIYDLGHQAVELFDSAGAFEQRVRLEKQVMNPKGFDVLPNCGVVVSGGIFHNSNALHRFSAEGGLETSWHRVPETKNPRAGMNGGGRACRDATGRLDPVLAGRALQDRSLSRRQ